MKRILNIAALFIFIMGFSGCEKKPKQSCPLPFEETYLTYFKKNKDIFLVKGIASEIYEYGRNIKVIEDLKGNFTNKSLIFVWGLGSASAESGFVGLTADRLDRITQYQEGDTLIMFLEKAYKRFDEDIEKNSDYATLERAHSVLKFSNGYVTGLINNKNNCWETGEVETMLWKDLQKE